jgi:hypothetical protein
MPKKKSKQINSKVLQQRQKKFVTGLKRLFSSDTIVRHIDSKKLKVIDTDGSQYQEIIKNTFPDKYKRIRQMQDYNIYNTSTGFTMPRMQLFQDYEAMDKDPVLSSALDIYSDESTTLDEYGDLLVINSDNEEIKDVLNNLFYDILNIDFNL